MRNDMTQDLAVARGSRWSRMLALAALVFCGIGFFVFVQAIGPERLRDAVAATGPLAPIVYVLLKAATDPLTGLYNRRHFSRVLDQLYAEAQRYNKDLSCVMIDMDGFKQLNDTFGHQVGDQLLVLAGKVISANMRRMDVAARYGGDEFVLLLPHANADEAAGVAQRIRAEFKQASASIVNGLAT